MRTVYGDDFVTCCMTLWQMLFFHIGIECPIIAGNVKVIPLCTLNSEYVLKFTIHYLVSTIVLGLSEKSN